ncbi:MAG: hypothetical protein JNK78_17315 [Planctomycetes bacterium]|nr:hypothetical protein [Planctomycetota bacterium]
MPTVDVLPDLVLSAFQRRWRGKYRVTLPWRMRGLAMIAVAMSVPRDTTIQALSRMLPGDVLQLRMPLPAWRWVLRFLHTRRSILGSASDHQPWVTLFRSRGTPRQISWAATCTLSRAGLPGWRVSKLLRASWGGYAPFASFESAARRLLPRDSWMLELERACSAIAAVVTAELASYRT